jgi:hypothetical protein
MKQTEGKGGTLTMKRSKKESLYFPLEERCWHVSVLQPKD